MFFISLKITLLKGKKIFHGLVNYGTQASVLSDYLNEQGLYSKSASYRDKFSRNTNYELNNSNYPILKQFFVFFNQIRKLYWFFKFDIFHFYFGTTLFFNQLDLPFYSFFGKKVIMHYLGYDVQLYGFSISKYQITNVAYYKDKIESLKLDSAKLSRLNFEKKYVDYQIVCAPYISEFVPEATILPLAINLKRIDFSKPIINNGKLVFLHAPTSRGNKGTNFIIEAFEKLISEGFDIELKVVENSSHENLLNMYKHCDVFIDQLLGGWYGTASIESMSVGRATICFIRESYFEYINYGNDLPIINADINNIHDVIKQIYFDRQSIVDIGVKSRSFVEKIHSLNSVGVDLFKIYQSLYQ